jgi:hypothetical protein
MAQKLQGIASVRKAAREVKEMEDRRQRDKEEREKLVSDMNKEEKGTCISFYNAQKKGMGQSVRQPKLGNMK